MRYEHQKIKQQSICREHFGTDSCTLGRKEGEHKQQQCGTDKKIAVHPYQGTIGFQPSQQLLFDLSIHQFKLASDKIEACNQTGVLGDKRGRGYALSTPTKAHHK